MEDTSRAYRFHVDWFTIRYGGTQIPLVFYAACVARVVTHGMLVDTLLVSLLPLVERSPRLHGDGASFASNVVE